MISLLIGFALGAGVPTLLLRRWLARKRRQTSYARQDTRRSLALLRSVPKGIDGSYYLPANFFKTVGQTLHVEVSGRLPADIEREMREKVLHGTRFQ